MRADVPKIAVLGAGSWGTTFAKVLADANSDLTVTLWARRTEVAREINTEHRNSAYLPEIELPAHIVADSDVHRVLTGAALVVIAVPSQSLRQHAKQWREFIASDAVVLSLMKGLEAHTDLRMSQVIGAELSLPIERVAVLSGPNLALEIAKEEPTASVVACTDHGTAQWIARLSSNGYFRPYTTDDVVGVEFGGIVKNVIALAVGICDGKNLGENTRASLMTRGLAETTRLALAQGANAETMAGLAGLGDLVATCSSPLSRNRTAGRLLGEGLSAAQVGEQMSQIAEGIKSAPAVLQLAQTYEVSMPITEVVVDVLEGRLHVDGLLPQLLARELEAESEPGTVSKPAIATPPNKASNTESTH